MNQGGFALQIPRPELYYELLPAHYVKIHAQRGVKIGGLWYGKSDPALGPYQGKLSDRGGQLKGKWVIRSDRRDRRAVFFQDPADPSAWHVLRWNGLPPEGEIPAFSDKTAEELLREARASRLSPQSDADLLPVLLKMLGRLVPAAQWPTQLGKKEKKDRAREAAQGDQAASDRHGRRARRSRPGRRQRGDGSPLALAGACGSGQRRPRRRAPPETRAGRPAAARPARVPGRPSALGPACWRFPGRTSSDRGRPDPGPGSGRPAAPASFLPGPVPDRTVLGGLEPVAADPTGLRPGSGDYR